jgi:hypothetical protein
MVFMVVAGTSWMVARDAPNASRGAAVERAVSGARAVGQPPLAGSTDDPSGAATATEAATAVAATPVEQEEAPGRGTADEAPAAEDRLAEALSEAGADQAAPEPARVAAASGPKDLAAKLAQRPASQAVARPKAAPSKKKSGRMAGDALAAGSGGQGNVAGAPPGYGAAYAPEATRGGTPQPAGGATAAKAADAPSAKPTQPTATTHPGLDDDKAKTPADSAAVLASRVDKHLKAGDFAAAREALEALRRLPGSKDQADKLAKQLALAESAAKTEQLNKLAKRKKAARDKADAAKTAPAPNKKADRPASLPSY